MARVTRFKGVMQTTPEIYRELINNGSVTVDGTTYEYDPGMLYITEAEEKPVVNSINGKTGDVQFGSADLTDASTLLHTSDIGTSAGKIPVLSSNGKLDENLLPAVALTDIYEASSESAMLALTAQKGDVCIRTDINRTFVLRGTPANVLSNWIELRTPTDTVLSVNGKTGAVELSSSDLTDGNTLAKSTEVDTKLETATDTINQNVTELLTNKVDNSTFNNLEARVTTTETDILELNNSVVKKTDYATTTEKGVVAFPTWSGLTVSNGQAWLKGATDVQIQAKNEPYIAISTTKIDLAVKVGLTTNTLSLTDEEKQAAQTWLGTPTVAQITALQNTKADKTEIPTKVSALENDATYVTLSTMDTKLANKADQTALQTIGLQVADNTADITELQGKVADKTEFTKYVAKAGATLDNGVVFGTADEVNAIQLPVGKSLAALREDGTTTYSAINILASGAVDLGDHRQTLLITSKNRPLVMLDGNFGDMALTKDIPTKVSELTNDSKYLTTIPDEYITETELTAKGYDTITNVDSKIATNLNTAKSYADTKVANLINSAPETLDTLGEVATAIQNNATVVEALNNAIVNKADKTAVSALTTRVGTNETNIIDLQTNKLDKADVIIKELSTQAIRITDLTSGIYKLTYAGVKYIYYDGATGYNSQTTYTTDVVYLFVTHYTGSAEERWHWYFVGGSTKPTYFYTGTTTTTTGNCEYIAFSSTSSVATNSDSLLTSKGAYADTSRVTLNGTSVREASFYAPTGYGTSGHVLVSKGRTAPDWVSLDSIKPEYDYSEIKNTPTIPEGSKLYTETGTNTDGAMTQKATTDALNLKADKNASNITTSSWLSKLGTSAASLNYLNDLHTDSQNMFYGFVDTNKNLQTYTWQQLGPNIWAHGDENRAGFSMSHNGTQVTFTQTYQDPSRQDNAGSVNIKITQLKPNTKYYTSYEVLSYSGVNTEENSFFNANIYYAIGGGRTQGSFTTNANGEYDFWCYFNKTTTGTGTVTIDKIMVSEKNTSIYASLAHRYVVDSWISSDTLSWYRIWNDGFKECGITVSGATTTTFTLPITFNTTTYVSVPYINGNWGNVYGIMIKSKTNNQIVTHIGDTRTIQKTLYCCGY